MKQWQDQVLWVIEILGNDGRWKSTVNCAITRQFAREDRERLFNRAGAAKMKTRIVKYVPEVKRGNN